MAGERVGGKREPLRIVFAGTAAFAVPSLDALVQAGHNIVLVVTQPDRLGGRGLKPLPSPVKVRASELGLPIVQPERIRGADAQDSVRQLSPDAMVVVAYGQILPASLIEAPRLGTVNVHASLLPRHRGPAPIEWAILGGDPETGVTIMQMDAGVDTGPMLAQHRLGIGPEETAGQLESRLAQAGAQLLVKTLEELAQGRISPTPQPSDGATQAPRLTSKDGKLDPSSMSAVEIDRRVRALGERVGTWMHVQDAEVKVLRGHPDGFRDERNSVPVSTAKGTYVLEEVQPPGGRRMSAGAWLRGRR